jgi:hypothetical protein
MHCLIRNKAVVFAILFFVWIHFGDPGVDFAGVSNHDEIDPNPTFLKILDSMPRHAVRVPDDSTFGVLVESVYGIDTTDPYSIRFEIDDGVHFPYQRDLSSDTIWAVFVEDEDPHQMLIWVVYDRSLETYLPPLYNTGRIVRITVNIIDSLQHRLPPQKFWFNIEPDPGRTIEFSSLPEYDYIHHEDLISDARYDAGMEILSGELAGAKILYNSQEPLTPGFGPVNEIEAVNLKDTQGVGAPLNLVPHTIFHTPLKLLIPFPPGTDIEGMDIFYYNGVEWVRACDADGNVLPGGKGWMVAGSRVNHYLTDLPQIEFQVYHFSAAQGGFVVVKTEDDDDSSGTTIVAKCFIDTAVSHIAKPAFGLLALLLILGTLGMLKLFVAHQHFRGMDSYLKKNLSRQDKQDY